MKSITVHGRTYAHTTTSRGAKQRQTEQTEHGRWRRLQKGVLLMRPDGRPVACVVKNRHGDDPFLVTAHTESTSGRTSFMFGLTETDREWLGIPDSYRAEREAAAALYAQAYPQGMRDAQEAGFG
jgi:hypothetical protein